MDKQIVKFVIDRELDIENYFIGLSSYKRNKEQGFPQFKNDKYENLFKLGSQQEIRKEIERSIEGIYKKKDKLNILIDDLNNEWVKLENDFIKKLEEVHKNSFPFTSVKGVLSSAGRFGYRVNENWFATDMFGNKFRAIDTATHELMHFMFHKYYWQKCKEKGLAENLIWDIKEAFTVLLNLEFDEFRFQADNGYAPHAKLREIIKKSWEKDKDFDKTLESVTEFVLKK